MLSFLDSARTLRATLPRLLVELKDLLYGRRMSMRGLPPALFQLYAGCQKTVWLFEERFDGDFIGCIESDAVSAPCSAAS